MRHIYLNIKWQPSEICRQVHIPWVIISHLRKVMILYGLEKYGRLLTRYLLYGNLLSLSKLQLCQSYSMAAPYEL